MTHEPFPNGIGSTIAWGLVDLFALCADAVGTAYKAIRHPVATAKRILHKKS